MRIIPLDEYEYYMSAIPPATVCHDVRCSACRQRPMVGLRYQCLRCLGYNLCQDCFLHQLTSRRHKPSHPMQEYCHEVLG